MGNISELSDIQAESAVIGTLLFHPDFIAHTDYLKPGHFFGVENGCVYWAIQELFKSGIMNIDAQNISNMLNSHKGVIHTIEKYNLPEINELIDLYSQVARHSVPEYRMVAEKVTSMAFKRALVRELDQLSEKCYDDAMPLDELSNVVYRGIGEVTTKFMTNADVQLMGEIIDDAWQEIVDRRIGNGLSGIPSKFASFNKYFTYETGELVVIQAKYKQGKSALIMNEVVHKLENDIPTLVIDREMKTRLYIERLISHITGIEVHRIKSGDYNAEEEQAINDCREWIKTRKFYHKFAPSITDEELYSMCSKLKNSVGLQFVVYDYMKSNESDSSANYNLLGAKCDFLKNTIAGELDLAVLAACQLNRGGEVADSIKINQYLSVGIKWGHKTQEQIARDGLQCGNYMAKIYVNRLGEQMQEDDEYDYIDFAFDGSKMLIEEAEKHSRPNEFS